jgi:CHAT domain-containing protein
LDIKSDDLRRCGDRLSKLGSANLGQKVDQFINSKILSVQEVQGLLRKDEVLLAFHFQKGYAHSWLITDEATNFIKLEASYEQILNLTTSLRQNLIVKNPRLLKPFDKNSSTSLYQALIQPHEKYLINKKSLILLQNKLLEGLPLSVLIQKGKNEGRWLFQDYNLSKILSTADLLKKKDTKRAFNSFYGFGNPPSHPYLQDLEHTKTELRNLAKAFVSEEKNLFFQERSTIENLKKVEKDIKSLAFSTHSVRPNEIKGVEEHALLLNEEWLTASKVAFDFEINAEIVLLSACHTSWSSEQYEKPLLDLPSAFIISGAESTIVSNWKITDESTKDIMTKASDYIYINKGKEGLISEALRNGMIDYIEDNQDKLIQTGARQKISKAHPYFWAPFEVLGNPRSKGI